MGSSAVTFGVTTQISVWATLEVNEVATVGPAALKALAFEVKAITCVSGTRQATCTLLVPDVKLGD